MNNTLEDHRRNGRAIRRGGRGNRAGEPKCSRLVPNRMGRLLWDGGPLAFDGLLLDGYGSLLLTDGVLLLLAVRCKRFWAGGLRRSGNILSGRGKTKAEGD